MVNTAGTYSRAVILASLLVCAVMAVTPSSPQASQLSVQAVAQMVLDISPVQIVGQPLITRARILLLDSTGALTTNYDLAANPITIMSSGNGLSFSTISNPAYLDSGIVDFILQGVVYNGPTGNFNLSATNGTITSPEILVSFNGYDVTAAVDISRQTITTIYSNLPTTVHVIVQNKGTKLASSNPDLRSFFASGGGSVRIFFPPLANGLLDTVSILLPTENIAPGFDTLILQLESRYTVNGSTYSAYDSLRVPVRVFPPLILTPTIGSFRPDSVYPGVGFDMSFDILASGIQSPIDSTHLSIYLADSVNGSALTQIYGGSPRNSSIQPNLIQYRGLGGLVQPGAVQPGCYPVMLDYDVYFGGNSSDLSNRFGYTLCVLPVSAPVYKTSSFGPLLVAGGKEASFQFTLTVNGPTRHEIEPSSAIFQLTTPGFTASSQLTIPGNTLLPGDNLIRTESIFLPAERSGDSLIVTATLNHRLPGADNYLDFTTNFGNSRVVVTAVPVVKIIDVSVVAPNSPKVNINQLFQVRALIANVSTVPTDTFTVRLDSDHPSTFDSLKAVPSISPGDTAEVLLSVIASTIPNLAGILRVDLISPSVTQLPPEDNIALVTIQTPAQLTLSPLLSGAPGGVVDTGAQFTLEFLLRNDGQGEASAARYQFSTNGVDFGLADPTVGFLPAGGTLALTLTAPLFDTTAQLDFTLTAPSLDRNSGLPAEIGDTTFSFTVAVASSAVALFVSGQPANSNLVLTQRDLSLALFEFINLAPTIAGPIALNRLVASVTSLDDTPLDPSLVFTPLPTILDENQTIVANAQTDGERLYFTLPSLTVTQSDTMRLFLSANVREDSPDKFKLVVPKDSIQAEFTSGPTIGQVATIGTDIGSPFVLNQTYVKAQDNFAGSLAIRNNPFNPALESAEFRFVPPPSGSVDFQVFTLMGEKVFERTLSQAEMNDGSDPFTSVTWNGRNGEGDFVLNGVYMVTITHGSTGQQGKIKVVVIK